MLDLNRRFALLSCMLCLLVASSATAQVSVRNWSFGSVGGSTASSSNGALVLGGTPVLGVTDDGSVEARFGLPASLGRGAPTGSIVTTSAPAGQQSTITALLQDDVGVVSATLIYLNLDTLVPVPMEETIPGSWRAVIPAGALNVKGFAFYLEVSDASRTTRIPASGFANLTVELNDFDVFTVTDQYAMRGISFEPDDDNPLSVFDELGVYDKTKWRYGTFDGTQYDEPTAAESAEPGQGFWIIAKTATAIDVDGGTTNRVQDFQIDLHPGFNQIANPFGFPVGVGSIAFGAGVEANLIAWNGTGYQQLQPALEPFTGYWINNSDGAVRSITVSPQEFIPIGAKEPRAPWALAVGEAGWSYEAIATVGQFHDGENHFGLRAGATEQIDSIDFHDAPPPPAGYVSWAFLRDDERLLTDFVSASVGGATWTASLRSDQGGEPFAVDFALSGSLDPSWEVWALDESGSRQHDLKQQPRLTGVVGDGDRRWILVAGPSSYVQSEQERVQTEYADGLRAFALRAPSPNPFGGADGTTFSLALPRKTHVSLKVYDLRGRHVATLVDEPLERGLQRVTWQGDDERGRPVAAGVYFVRMRAADTRAVRKVVVSR